MPTWFLLSLLSTIAAGLFVFMQKIAAMRNYNANILNTYSAATSAGIGLFFAAIFEGFTEFSSVMVGLAVAAGVMFIIGSNLRMDALRYIDSTIFFPLHKFASPLFALIIGVFIFKESLTQPEWIGVILGLITPLLLITKSENARQHNLVKGLIFMIISACLAAASVSVNKQGTDIFASVLLFASVTQICSAIFGLILKYIHSKSTKEHKQHNKTPVSFALIMGVVQYVSFIMIMLAFSLDGMLSVVYTINSMYILIPIVLSIIYYNEHWNLQKALAIALSLLALFFIV